MRREWVRRSGGAIAVVCLAFAGCRAFVSLDGLDDGAPLKPDAGAGDAPTEAATASEGGGSDVVGSDAALVPPVVRQGTDVTGAVSITVDGRYKIEFDQPSGWLPRRWFDLAHSPTEDLGDTPAFSVPYYIDYSGGWKGPAEASDITIGLGEESPARVQVRTHRHHFPPADAGFDAGEHLSIEGSYWFYPSGRVTADQYVGSNIPVSQTLDRTEYAHTSVARTLTWDVLQPTASSFAFTRTGGPTPASRVLVINHGPETDTGSNRTTNRYWKISTPTIVPSDGALGRVWEFVVGARGLSDFELAEHADDVRGPGIAALEGCDLVDTGYEYREGAYRVVATGPRVRVLLTNTLSRYSPALVVDGWKNATWTVKLGSAVVGTSAQGRSPYGVVAQIDWTNGNGDPDKRLVVSYVGKIPIGAGDADRTFTVE